jgi:hypothetical protein
MVQADYDRLSLERVERGMPGVRRKLKWMDIEVIVVIDDQFGGREYLAMPDVETAIALRKKMRAQESLSHLKCHMILGPKKAGAYVNVSQIPGFKVCEGPDGKRYTLNLAPCCGNVWRVHVDEPNGVLLLGEVQTNHRTCRGILSSFFCEQDGEKLS